jgi:pilus assembly protein CpaF
VTPLGVLAQPWRDPDVTDVLVNGPGEVWVERAGELEPAGIRVDAEQLALLCERLLHPLSVPLDRTHPVAEARLADGTRLTVVVSPVARHGPVLALRRPSRRGVELADFGPPSTCAALRQLVAARANVLVAGSTGAGKTALLGALCATCHPKERLVVIEDTAELVLDGPQVVRLEGREHPAGPVDALRHLVRAALRLRPDRIVVGEVRGAEALDMVTALNTGHRGSMSTVHAGTVEGALARLETMCLMAPDAPADAVARQVRQAVDAVVLVRRVAGSRRREVERIWCASAGGTP